MGFATGLGSNFSGEMTAAGPAESDPENVEMFLHN